ncbi:uncharacterized protein PRCAT00002160001 [Priceomyces carsonii]|uniref:uncharacterized protein n=1 Tax=Priceomyces carsonii TaxID=28549 RepID=UPI002EDB6ACA|nr:unnamed protein product [Priceomyces carsonii]
MSSTEVHNEKDEKADASNIELHSVSEELKDEKNIDLGVKFLLQHPEYADYSPEEAKRVLWKIDLLLMPIMTIIVLLAAADKILISNAAVYGMKEDAHLVGSQYSWLGSIFYFGYLVMEYPANYLLQKLPVVKTLSISFIFWNIILMCMAAGKSFGSLAAMRFLLGMGESFLFPAMTVITSMFYTKAEQPLRTSIWFSGFSSIITGVLSYALGHSSAHIDKWRLLFLVFGAITLFFTIIMYFILPDSPMSCRYFTDKEKYIAIHRTQLNRTGIKNTEFKRDQLIEALLDWKTWVMCIFVLSINISNGGLVTFAAQIVSGLGYSPLRTTLLGMPTGVFMAISGWLIAIPSKYSPKRFRTVITAIVCICPIVCCILMMKVTNNHSRLAAYYFFYFYWGPYVSMITLSIANTSGHTKKTVVNAADFLTYCVANIIAPQFFIPSQAPSYPTGYNAILGFTAVALVTILIYGVGCAIENNRREKTFGPASENFDSNADALDLTDKQKERYFRYCW